jgi:hypothetical protein
MCGEEEDVHVVAGKEEVAHAGRRRTHTPSPERRSIFRGLKCRKHEILIPTIKN